MSKYISINRLRDLQEMNKSEDLGWGDLAEIQDAFDKIPQSELRDLRENAMVDDMLDELDSQVTETEQSIFNWVAEHFGDSEALDPSWDIGALAEHLDEEFAIVSKNDVRGVAA